MFLMNMAPRMKYEELTEKIIQVFYEVVYAELGYGFLE